MSEARTERIQVGQPEAGVRARVVTALERGRDWLLDQYLRKWVVLGILIGIVAGLGAIVFFQAIEWSSELLLGHIAGYEPPVPRGEGDTVIHDIARPWTLPLVVGLGGLLSGLIVFTLAPEAEGHGTDAAIEAFHERGGRIRSRIPVIKLVASAVTIGSGGSAGREGPTAQIAAGFGSWLGSAFRLSPADCRVALAVGVGAGIGAIFKAPLGGALLSAEILYLRDFELEALIPGFIASVIGYAIFASWAGWDPIFGNALGFRFTEPESLVWYAALGVLAGVVGIVYVRGFYGTRDFFQQIPIPPHVKPAIAGVLVGVIAIWRPEILATGYGWLQLAIEGDTASIATRVMLLLVLLKVVATSLTIGSGGSGGVFAPGLFVGGMLGAGLWAALDGHAPGLPSEPEPFVVVGMGALFGGIAKAPIAVMLMVAEMTGEFTMIVPAMIATSASYLITGDTTIYESQVATRADSPAHRGEYTIPLIQTISVGQAMRPAVALRPDDAIERARELVEGEQRQGIVVEEAGELVGVLSPMELLTAPPDATLVREAMRPADLVAYQTDSLHTALQRMTRQGVSGLPVVERERPERLVGYISLADLARVLDLEVNELAERPENVRAATNDPLRFVTVEETMSRRFRQFRTDATLHEVAAAMAEQGDHAAVVVDDDGALAGIVTVPDLARAAAADVAEDVPVGNLATRKVVVARVGQFIADALAQPGAEAARQVPVITERDGRLVPVGLLRRNDVLVAYLRGRERLAASSRIHGNGNVDAEEVIATEVAVERGGYANGRTLAELGLPADTVVTGVERDGRLLVPRGQLRLLTGDRVRLLGSRGAIPAAIRKFNAPIG